MLLGLAAPDGGGATIDGMRYRDLPHPARAIGAALDNDCFHPGRSAVEHLRVVATAAGISRSSVARVLGLVGLTEARHRRVGGFSLGRDGITARLVSADTVEIRGADPDRVARIAAAAGVVVLELSRHTDNLEELFFDLVSDRGLEVSPS